MITVADRVKEEWDERAALVKKPRIDLLLSTDKPEKQALDALRDALGAAVAQLDPGDDLPDGYDEPRVGECRIAALPDGVVLQIYDSDMLEQLLGLVAAGLEQRGVAGSLDVYEHRLILPPPAKMPLIECRMRVRGERHHIRSWAHRWTIDPDAYQQVVDAGAHWCMKLPHLTSIHLGIDVLPRIEIGQPDDLEALLREAVQRTGIVSDLTTATLDHYRTMAISPADGCVTLIDAGAEIRNDQRWQEPVRELTEFLKANSPQLVYGYIKHGSEWGQAMIAKSLEWDWPRRPDTTYGVGRGSEPFEDGYAPDAFAIQLLGPGYTGRIPDAQAWRRTELDDGGVVLEHTDPAAWFDTPFAPFGGMNGRSDAFDPPEVLARARQDLSPILFRDEIATRQ